MKSFILKSSLLTLTIALTGCGGGGGGGGDDTLSSLTKGYQIPTEISAIPERDGGAFRPVSELPSSSDYVQAVPRRYVEEQALEQFDILEQVLGALGQTHFADSENINAGPYKAMVAWEDEQDGRAIKQLQPWVIDSLMIIDDEGRDVNRVLAWIEETDSESDDGKKLIKAEVRIYAGATIGADGTVTDYGEWEMNVQFGDSDDFFTASSSTEDGVNVLMVQDSFLEGPPGAETVVAMKGILYRSSTSGFGQIQYPDWESCWSNEGGSDGCVPSPVTAQYAYNDKYIAVQQDDDPVAYRSRESTTDMTHEYGLFYQETDAPNDIVEGDNLEKHKSFGFPITYKDSSGFTQYAYYGAWQGRHELWGGGPDGQIAAGTTVTKENFSGDTPTTYTVSQPFNGTFTKRSLFTAELESIKGIPVETWINDNYDLTYDAGTWKYCDGYTDWSSNTPVCKSRSPGNPTIQLANFSASDFASLVMGDGGRKWVDINQWDGTQNIDYVYLANNPQPGVFNFAGGAGFYEAQQGFNGNMTPIVPAVKYSPADGDNLWVNIGGSIYIQYTGDFGPGKTGWVEKQLVSFNEQNWSPEFASSTSDVSFSPEQGNEYYINNQGANYIVRRVAASGDLTDYEVKYELQSTANPVNFATLLPAGTSYLRTPWNTDVQFTLVTEPTSPNFLKLVYLTDDPNTAGVDEFLVTTVYTSGEWGLQAYNVSGQPLTADGTIVTVDQWGFPDVGQPRPAEFNWEYSDGGWGTQQFLIDGDGAYVVLADPVQLTPIMATNGAGVAKTLSLQFDGWMHGMPDMYGELAQSDWVMNSDIADKIFNLPAGTEVTDTNGIAYFVKPLDISVFLDSVTAGEISAAGDTVPDITNASQADLTTVPGLVPHGMGDMPTGTVVKYSEGNPV